MIEDRDRRQISPHLYLLCTLCAEKLRPPLGWTLEDRRSKTLAERFEADSLTAAAAQPEPDTRLPHEVVRAPARRPDSPPLEPAAQSRQVFFGFSS